MFQATIENRKLAVDLANVIIEWEIRRTKEEQQDTTEVWQFFAISSVGIPGALRDINVLHAPCLYIVLYVPLNIFSEDCLLPLQGKVEEKESSTVSAIRENITKDYFQHK